MHTTDAIELLNHQQQKLGTSRPVHGAVLAVAQTSGSAQLLLANPNADQTIAGSGRTLNIAGSLSVTNNITMSGLNLERRLNHLTSRFVLGNNDWTGLIYASTGGVPVYDAAARGVSFNNITQWVQIRVRMPVDPDSTYHLRAKLTKVSGNGSIYIGAKSLDSSYNEIATDTMSSYNYFAASSVALAAGNSQIFEGTISGYNPAAPTAGVASKFDPEAKYFDIVIICNYNGTGSPQQTVVEWLELRRLPAKLLTTASTTTVASLNIPHGTAPTAPVNGDVWTTTAGLLVRVNGATHTLAGKEIANSWTALQTFSAGLTVSGGTLTLPAGSVADTALTSNIFRLDVANTLGTNGRLIIPTSGAGSAPTAYVGSSNQNAMYFDNTLGMVFNSSHHHIFNLDSDNGGTNAEFRININSNAGNSGTNVFKVTEAGAVTSSGDISAGGNLTATGRNVSAPGGGGLTVFGDTQLTLTSNGGVVVMLDQDNNATSNAFCVRTNNTGTNLLAVLENGDISWTGTATGTLANSSVIAAIGYTPADPDAANVFTDQQGFRRAATSDTAFYTAITTDTVARLLVRADGSMEWGPGGTTARDTNLYRSAANTLKTDDALVVTGNLTLGANIILGLSREIQFDLNNKLEQVSGTGMVLRSGSNVGIYLDNGNGNANSTFTIYNSVNAAAFTVGEDGNVTWTGTATGTLDASSVQAVGDPRYLQLSGGTLTGDLTMGNGTIIQWNADNYLSNASGNMTLASAGDIILQLDSNNNGSNSLLVKNGAGSTIFTMTEGGGATFANSQTINFNNSTISGVNNIQIGDPGPGEGIEWAGGNGWKIYESPDDLTTNTAGNLQFVSGGSRRLTLENDGDVHIPTGMLVADTGRYLLSKGGYETRRRMFGGQQDLAWKRVLAASNSETGSYKALAFRGVIRDHAGNYGQSIVTEYPFTGTFRFRDANVTSDNALLKLSYNCPDIIRVIKVGVNSYELQVRQHADWKMISYELEILQPAVEAWAFYDLDTATTGTLVTPTYDYPARVGNLEANTITEGGTLLSAKYLPVAGGTVTGATTFSGAVNMTGDLTVKDNFDFMGPTNATLGGRIIMSDTNYHPLLSFYRWTGTASDYWNHRLRLDETGTMNFESTGASGALGAGTYVKTMSIGRDGGVNIANNLFVGTTADTADRIIRAVTGANYRAGFEAFGTGQGSGYMYVGQDGSYGGGMIYDGDTTPALYTGGSSDQISFFRRNAGTSEVVFGYMYNSNTVTFRGGLQVQGSAGAFTTAGWVKGLEFTTGIPVVKYPHTAGWSFGHGVASNGQFRIIRSDATDGTGTANYDFAISIAGNVTIGTTTDNGTDKLQVVGSASIQGAFSANSLTTTGDTSTNNLILTGSIKKDNPISVLTTGGAAQKMYLGGLLVSSSYADATNIPTNGAWIKGDLQAGSFGGSVKIKTYGSTGSTGNRWIKVARIQNTATIDGSEKAIFSGRVKASIDFGYTADHQYLADFTFGVRTAGIITPILVEHGDHFINGTAKAEWAIYTGSDGYNYLYFYQSRYSNGVTFEYINDFCTEYWVDEDPTTVVGHTLAWSSTNGIRQGSMLGTITSSSTNAAAQWNNFIATQTDLTQKGRMAFDENGLWITSNAYHDGTNWQRDNTGTASFAFVGHHSSNRFEWRTANAAAGTVGWTTAMYLDMDGDLTVAKTVTADAFIIPTTTAGAVPTNFIGLDAFTGMFVDATDWLVLNSKGDVTINLDSNNNETDRTFRIRNNSQAFGTTNTLFSVNESGNAVVSNNLTAASITTTAAATVGTSLTVGTTIDAQSILLTNPSSPNYGLRIHMTNLSSSWARENKFSTDTNPNGATSSLAAFGALGASDGTLTYAYVGIDSTTTTSHTSTSQVWFASRRSAIGTTTDDGVSKLNVAGQLKATNLELAGSIGYDDVSRYWLKTATNWGIYWDTTNNQIQFHGGGNNRANIDLDDGSATFGGTVSAPAFSATGASGYQTSATNGYGYRFWASDNHKIWMSTATDGTWGGRVSGETTSDYNMYFRMVGGTNRGFVWLTGADTGTDLPLMGLNPDALRLNVDLASDGVTSSLYGVHLLGTNIRVQASATPALPTVTPQGTTGATSYSYYVVAVNRNGKRSPVSAVRTISNGNATLSATNFNRITWTAVPGAASYDILKTNTSTKLGSVAATATLQLDDIGQATSAYTAPTRNETGDVDADGVITADLGFVTGNTFINTSGVIDSSATYLDLRANNSSYNNGIILRRSRSSTSFWANIGMSSDTELFLGVQSATTGVKINTAGKLTAPELSAPDLSTAAIGLMNAFVIRGTGFNNMANRLVKVGGTTHVNSASRGLVLTILNKSDHSMVSSVTYDTYGASANSDALATAIDGITKSQIGILTSADAWEAQISTNLRTAMKRVGLYKGAEVAAGQRVPYAAIFEGADTIAQVTRAVEVVHLNSANQPHAEIRGWLMDGSFSAAASSFNSLTDPSGTIQALTVSPSGTMTAAFKLTTVAPVTGSSGFNLPHGTAPTTLANGDLWTTTGGMFLRLNGSTRTVAFLQLANAWAAKQTMLTSTASSASIRVPHGVDLTSGWADGDIWSTINGFFLRVNGATKKVATTDTNGVLDGQLKRALRVVTTATVVVAATDDALIMVPTVDADMTVTLPAAPTTGEEYRVKEGKGIGNDYTITVDGNGKTIDGQSTFVMYGAYASFIFIYNGTQWNVM